MKPKNIIGIGWETDDFYKFMSSPTTHFSKRRKPLCVFTLKSLKVHTTLHIACVVDL